MACNFALSTSVACALTTVPLLCAGQKMTASEDVVKKWIDLASDKKDDVKAVEAFFAEHKGKGLDINVRLQNHSALTNAGRKFVSKRGWCL